VHKKGNENFISKWNICVFTEKDSYLAGFSGSNELEVPIKGDNKFVTQVVSPDRQNGNHGNHENNRAQPQQR